MPRRAGKAASRRARQRATQRGTRPALSLPRPQAEAAPPVGTPDTHEADSLGPARRVSPPSPAVVGGSRLSDRMQADYHYVERDLRNIAVISALMVGLLFAAWAIFQALGLTP